MSSNSNDIALSQFFSCRNRNKWSDPLEWTRMMKEVSKKHRELHISSDTDDDEEGIDISIPVHSETHKKDIIRHGYTLLPNLTTTLSSSTNYNALVTKVAAGVTALSTKLHLPATFVLLFDETWKIASIANHILKQTSHPNNVFNFDALAWYIDASGGMAGFSPHRDRQPANDDVRKSFHEDGQAKYVTLWMALTNATPENSCLYVIPKPFDPGYLQGDDVDDSDSGSGSGNDTAANDDPLTRCLQSKESYQNIRALPRQSGESVAFTHRILHWGSRGNDDCKDPRIAISFVSSDPAFEKPYLKNYEKYMNWKYEGKGKGAKNSSQIAWAVPPFQVRLLLVCSQLLIYYQRFDLPKETIRACYEYCKENRHELDDSYWKKVSIEFVKAMKEVRDGDGDDDGVSPLEGESAIDDDEDEALLEAMLENADEMEDDFDEMDYDDNGGTNGDGAAGNQEVDGGSDSEEGGADMECNLFAPVKESGGAGVEDDETPDIKKRREN